MRATKAIINTSNFKHNLNIVKKLTPPKTLQCLAVKADGYGHGAIGIARLAQTFGVDYLGIATINEAIELRKNKISLPILLLGSSIPKDVEFIYKYNIEIIIYTKNAVEEFSSALKNKTIRVHLKIDTGMGRIGCPPQAAVELAHLISKSKNLNLAGISTHFPVSDSKLPEDIEFTRNQIKLFLQTISKIKKAGIDTGIIHAANSGVIYNYPEAHFDMVRPGIIAYGYLPGGKANIWTEKDNAFMPKPVMSLESKLVHIKKVKKGSFISYGRRYQAQKDTWIGTIPLGYADGYTRQFSNRSKVLIDSKLYPVAGTICMDQFMVDLGEKLEVKLYDKVILFGDTKNAPTAETLTELSKTIPYELLCGISKRVPRIYK